MARDRSRRVLELTRAVYDGLLEHALDCPDREVCGVLAGDRRDGADDGTDGPVAVARGRHPVENVAADPRREYRIDPAELLALLEAVEDAGETVVGFYHSHPAGPPEPSPTDVARARWPDHSYAIVSLGGDHPYVGSWRWTGERFVREAVAVRG